MIFDAMDWQPLTKPSKNVLDCPGRAAVFLPLRRVTQPNGRLIRGTKRVSMGHDHNVVNENLINKQSQLIFQPNYSMFLYNKAVVYKKYLLKQNCVRSVF